MTVELLTEHHVGFLKLKGGCTGSSEPTLVKMPHCWKSHVTAHILTDLHSSSTFYPCYLCFFLVHLYECVLTCPAIGQMFANYPFSLVQTGWNLCVLMEKSLALYCT